MDRVLWLHEVGTGQVMVGLLGGKAASLGELFDAGFPVPEGFVVTSEAYEETILAGSIGDEIRRLVDQIDASSREGLWACSAQIRRTIESVEIGRDLESQVVIAYNKLQTLYPNTRVAVRSSSTAEDIVEASSAGMQDTYLNVEGISALLRSIKRCWASLWTDRAIAYRLDKGISYHQVRMAVIVQQMIQSDLSGVIFTQHPMESNAVIVIEAIRGLGEALVSGAVRPNRYVVNKETGDIIEGITVEQPQAFESDSGKLSKNDVQRLVELACGIEGYRRWPQDIEWTKRGDDFFVLQSRPITTVAVSGVSDFFTEELPDDNLLWTSGFLNERFKLPVSPLGWLIMRQLIEEFAFKEPLRFVGFNRFDEIRFTKLYLGHPFVNVKVFQMLYKHFPAWLLPDDAIRFFPDGNTELRKQVELPTRFQFVLAALRTLLTDITGWPINHLVWGRFVVRYEKNIQEISVRIAKASTLRELIHISDALMELSSELLRIHRWSLTYAEVFYAVLRRLLKNWTCFQADSFCAELVAGQPNKSVLRDEDFWALATKLREAKEASADPQLQIARIRVECDDFLRKFGHRRSENLDIFYPSYADAPEQLLGLLESTLGSKSVSSLPERFAERKKKSLKRAAELSEALSKRLVDIPKLWFVRLVLKFTQEYMQLREDQRHYWEKAIHLTRQVFLGIGKLLVTQNVLKEQGDIFFLTRSEIVSMSQGSISSAQAKTLVVSRKREFGRIRRMYYPHFLRGNHPLLTEAPSLGDCQVDTLQGVGASPGIAKGIARVIAVSERLYESFQRVNEGDILVAVSTDPAWTPLFARVGGLVMEFGGLLSHGSVVAREYGVPAVVGVPNATAIIEDGREIMVNGMEGTVNLL